MKKSISLILILITSFMTFSFNNLDVVYAQKNLIKSKSVEEDYLQELIKIGDQIYILGSNSLDSELVKKEKNKLLNDAAFIKSQIRNLRIKLSEYHDKESGNEEKNPLSLALLNTLNYYSMSLSYLNLFLNSQSSSDKNQYLQDYYFSKAAGDQTLLWIKEQLNQI
ncbi:hypothetical protein JGS6364_01531 [[Clostridium] sordellii]|uniref:Uncharacterized protein n=1 Tax=Paraclostridium sordellii TaxID=1505 RepID=A0ABM9RPZ6_PARSO|nr:hypothetical protein [Paeniclostridium sordellii]CEJ74133.1 hypothetical protein ATCC9714_20211 [[Clostridium] sordellii] [Paeniclostridium sordellii]CEK29507.1 hypothetical protein JGS6364_01531 [[Clostridium] sordellii] [Paeniclostridium sordellii]CEN69678.1 Uncharacterised protein [[Clostridium] sordellii] [Paeniclostridium sordellii]CEN72946.1 Uncharacterised protein [[Clostridium] sordellii] [Paeniclostridium sordellii]CEO25328.1 Uncharacterised protein [[Clostridium] sordellii] [Paeni